LKWIETDLNYRILDLDSSNRFLSFFLCVECRNLTQDPGLLGPLGVGTGGRRVQLRDKRAGLREGGGDGGERRDRGGRDTERERER
jgi:hypothetical protein